MTAANHPPYWERNALLPTALASVAAMLPNAESSLRVACHGFEASPIKLTDIATGNRVPKPSKALENNQNVLPPAAQLDARTILQRQLPAGLVDKLDTSDPDTVLAVFARLFAGGTEAVAAAIATAVHAAD
jgi:hypothetical protein